MEGPPSPSPFRLPPPPTSSPPLPPTSPSVDSIRSMSFDDDISGDEYLYCFDTHEIYSYKGKAAKKLGISLNNLAVDVITPEEKTKKSYSILTTTIDNAGENTIKLIIDDGKGKEKKFRFVNGHEVEIFIQTVRDTIRHHILLGRKVFTVLVDPSFGTNAIDFIPRIKYLLKSCSIEPSTYNDIDLNGCFAIVNSMRVLEVTAFLKFFCRRFYFALKSGKSIS